MLQRGVNMQSCRVKDILLVAVPTLFDLIATVLVSYTFSMDHLSTELISQKLVLTACILGLCLSNLQTMNATSNNKEP